MSQEIPITNIQNLNYWKTEEEEIQITGIHKYKLQIYQDIIYRNKEKQTKEIDKYKLQKYRNKDDSYT